MYRGKESEKEIQKFVLDDEQIESIQIVEMMEYLNLSRNVVEYEAKVKAKQGLVC